MKPYLVLFFLIAFYVQKAEAQVSLAKIFTDNMVVQRDIDIPIWGKGSPEEAVTVLFNGQKVSGVCDDDGDWKVELKPIKAGGPYDMKVISSDTITLRNVLVGDVWLCTGQSNMWRPVSSILNAEKEIANANYPQIRLFSVPRTFREEPVEEIQILHPDEQKFTSLEWEVCSPQTAGGFSATGYFFGREIHQSQNVPIGLIKVCWGGTRIEPWMSLASLKSVEGYENIEKEIIDPVKLLDSVANDFKSLVKDKNDKGYPNGKAIWAREDLNVASWNKMELPQAWESAGLPDFDGTVWFRKSFHLPESLINDEFVLSLGEISDANQVWVNGKLIGSNNGVIPNSPFYQSIPKSNYIIKPGVLASGENNITVRVTNYVGKGGFIGNEQDLYVQSGSFKLSLAGAWHYKTGTQAEGQPPALARPHHTPTVLFNGMIKPLIPLAIKGVIWYQGESNTGSPENYSELFTTLVGDWRQRWGQGNFPFIFVQLANFGRPPQTPEESNWAQLREQQFKSLSAPNTGMAVAIDIGEAGDIHPKNKQDVGYRLALVAQEKVYEEAVVSSGPIFEKMAVRNDKAYLSFKTFGEKLLVKDRYGYARGFAIAGADKKFYWARGYLMGNQVVVFSPEVQRPVAVRYAWSKNPDDPNLYNEGGLPAVPFRSDDWDFPTETK